MPLSPQSRARPARPVSARRSPASRHQRVSLCETLDRVLNKGVVIAGDVLISIADVDLIYLGLNVVVTSVETMRKWEHEAPTPRLPTTQLEGEGT
ncbi:gas vesicle protein [Hyalangium gracile]|uniref:gas vesicle protein n=1 Tax=Hyalangium gracile TaxID=394092 RepID=UPI001CCBD9CC|nr:gas vesicle protein [Hyalangium gracile]